MKNLAAWIAKWVGKFVEAVFGEVAKEIWPFLKAYAIAVAIVSVASLSWDRTRGWLISIFVFQVDLPVWSLLIGTFTILAFCGHYLTVKKKLRKATNEYAALASTISGGTPFLHSGLEWKLTRSFFHNFDHLHVSSVGTSLPSFITGPRCQNCKTDCLYHDVLEGQCVGCQADFESQVVKAAALNSGIIEDLRFHAFRAAQSTFRLSLAPSLDSRDRQ